MHLIQDERLRQKISNNGLSKKVSVKMDKQGSAVIVKKIEVEDNKVDYKTEKDKFAAFVVALN